MNLIKSKLFAMLSTRRRMAIQYPDGDFVEELRVIERLLVLANREDAEDLQEIEALRIYSDHYNGGAIWFEIHIATLELLGVLKQKFKADDP